MSIEDGQARLRGALTFATVRTLYQQMEAHARRARLPGSVDLAEVSQIDSAGLALLLEWQAQFRRQTGSEQLMDIRNVPESLLKIARLCDAEQYLRTTKTPGQDDKTQ